LARARLGDDFKAADREMAAKLAAQAKEQAAEKSGALTPLGAG
jgi:hypothetical protein